MTPPNLQLLISGHDTNACSLGARLTFTEDLPGVARSEGEHWRAAAASSPFAIAARALAGVSASVSQTAIHNGGDHLLLKELRRAEQPAPLRRGE